LAAGVINYLVFELAAVIIYNLAVFVVVRCLLKKGTGKTKFSLLFIILFLIMIFLPIGAMLAIFAALFVGRIFQVSKLGLMPNFILIIFLLSAPLIFNLIVKKYRKRYLNPYEDDRADG
jgi:hypothetical protein